jgi:hypothetical protein
MTRMFLFFQHCKILGFHDDCVDLTCAVWCQVVWYLPNYMFSSQNTVNVNVSAL